MTLTDWIYHSVHVIQILFCPKYDGFRRVQFDHFIFSVFKRNANIKPSSVRELARPILLTEYPQRCLLSSSFGS